MTQPIKINKVFLAMLIGLALVITFSGCAERAPSQKFEDTEVVARINNYRLTVGDFKGDPAFKFAPKGLTLDPSEMKERILESIITKKILLQEAQGENVDKDKAFMKEIERYWEQALLKLLLKKKAEKLSRNVVVSQEEIKREYEKMLKEEGEGIGSFEKNTPGIKVDIYHRKAQKALNEWIGNLRKKASVRINRGVLEKIDIKSED